jgi:hypothetical protein
MRKEVLWAIVGGIILGLVVAFGVYRINSVVSGRNRGAGIATPTPKSDTLGEFKIVLDKPENDDVIINDSIAVTGLTKPLAWITLSGENGDYIIQSDSTGAFSQDVDLIPRVNQIKVTAFEASGKESATQVLVVYSSSFQVRTLPTSSPEEGASGTSDIRQKVAQDVANTLSRPKAYIGTVTDITDSTIQIKTTASEIKQISVTADGTTVINSTGTVSKTVKVTDIAIGDFIVAMGYINGNSVLAAQRILITDSITEPKITVSEAKVKSATRSALTVNAVSGDKEDSVVPDVNTDIETIKDGESVSARFSSIGADDVIIYVVITNSKGNDSVRSIFQLPKS